MTQIETALGYRFQDPTLRDAALTHPSLPDADQRTFQRLEFLGDRVLALTVAHWLYTDYPDAPEGELATRLTQLVSQPALASVARQAKLGDGLYLGVSERAAADAEALGDSVLSDALEALLGATFLDGGWAEAQQAIHRLWATEFARSVTVQKDPKSRLQEWAAARRHNRPTYALLDQTGPEHAPEFHVEVLITPIDARARGTGGAKKTAEAAAAANLLAKLGEDT